MVSNEKGNDMIKRLLFWVSLSVAGAMSALAQDTLIIQENALGQCTMDGKVMTNLSGWTGSGYIDALNGVGTTISWEIVVPTDGTYRLGWRYAFGGDSTNRRDSKVVIDGNAVIDTLMFYYTNSSWTSWSVQTADVPLAAGDHKIRLEAVRSGGIANIDYFMVIGIAPTAATCTPQYVVSVKSDSVDWGSVWYTPVKSYYDKGTIVTLHANAKAGAFFQCWMGEETSGDSAFTFAVKGNVNAVARFLPNNLTQDSAAMGYAAVEDDRGTPFWIFGGALGDTITVASINDMKTYLADALPHIVRFSQEFIGPDTIMVRSNKTILGVGANAHLRNIEVRLNQAQNVIIRNIIVSHVHPKDAIGINDKSRNILIDHCEFYSHRGDNDGDGTADTEADKDWYDGLLDIKNESSFITVAWSAFHDHYKVCLMASNDESYADSIARITFHHNYFYNCGSRLPLIRFGKAHIFNNYFLNSANAVNTRMGAWVRVERNYFSGVSKPVFDDGSAVGGRAQLIDNNFGGVTVSPLPECNLQVPYAYTLDPTDSIPSMVTRKVRTTSIIQRIGVVINYSLKNYPNPFNPSTTIEFSVGKSGFVSLKVFNVLGQEITEVFRGTVDAGVNREVVFDASKLTTGIYFSVLEANGERLVRKMLLLK
jgi:pectate lyase